MQVFPYLRSIGHCSSLCTSTFECSAFEFDKKTGLCGLGNKKGLVMPNPNDSMAQLSQIHIHDGGTNILKLFG
jgi:hypothetical protein